MKLIPVIWIHLLCLHLAVCLRPLVLAIFFVIGIPLAVIKIIKKKL